MKTEPRQPSAVRVRAQRSEQINWLTVTAILLILQSLVPPIDLRVSYDYATGWNILFHLRCGSPTLDKGEAAPNRKPQNSRSNVNRRLK